MRASEKDNTQYVRRHRFLQRGESMVASSGLAIAAILLAAMGASAWWASQTHQRSLLAVQEAELRALGDILSSTAESMLESGDLTALRRVISDASQRYELSRCVIVLPEGGIVADADPNHITTLFLPDVWSGSARTVEMKRNPASAELEAAFALSVPGRGALVLDMAAGPPSAPPAFADLQAGAGLVGALALVAMLGVYRRMRRRLVALGAIREALLAFERGVTNESALLLNTDFGTEAVAWNQLLRQKEEINRKLLEEKAEQSFGSRASESGAELHLACDAMRQGLILVDGQLRTRYINGAAAVMLRTTRGDCQDHPVGDYIDQPDVMAMLDSVASGAVRRWRSVEVEYGEDGTEGVLRFSARPVRQDDSASAMILIEDLTQARVADLARTLFVAQATHELRTPLTNIRLYVETALEEGEEDPEVRARCLNTINHESRRLERIVGDMLSVSELEAGSIRLVKDDVRLDALFEQLEADYGAMAREKSISLRFDLAPKLPVLQGDRDKISLALHNLLGNALKYTPQGGAVRVHVDIEGDRLCCEVSDTGIGIDSTESERIFEKFYRASNCMKTNATGSGLGLALAREVIRLHGGDIAVESEPDRGSKFTLTLPVLAEAA